jgi:hypothetical protein
MAESERSPTPLPISWRSLDYVRRVPSASTGKDATMRIRDKGELQKACDLIGQCGYWRRKQELEDAEEAAKDWY